ncbi:MAG TPA: ABC transporter ATP-binding protein [Thermodesulfovibrionales bacterium]|nr:ABC transporter ATP-binding protein [Thermodesulfovibrionales bacterium]
MIELRGIEKSYLRGAEEVHALRGLDLDINRNEFLSIMGPSGAGKTSLLHIIGCLDRPTRGSMKFEGESVEQMAESGLVALRRKRIGLVFQQFYLIPGLSVFDNVALPLLFNRNGETNYDRKERIASLLDLVGLAGRRDHLPSQLSGGEMQRVAIARALVNKPDLILADEPTGNLDSENSEIIFNLLRSLKSDGFTVAMITHNSDLASRADRLIRLKDGKIDPS